MMKAFVNALIFVVVTVDLCLGNIINYSNIRVPVKYDLFIDMASKFDNRGIVQPSGVMEIKFNVTKPTNIIKFHAHTAFIKIKSIEISSVAKYSFIKNETIFPDIVVLTLNENLLPNNEIQMKIRYNTKVVLNDTIGIFRGQSLNFQTLKNENYYVTQLESIELRKVFPSFDDISIKAKFTFSLKHFKTMTAISTSAIKRIDINGVYAISHFDETITMSTYVFGFALSSFRSTTFISNNNVTLKVWAPHEQYYTSLLVGETQIGIFNELTKYFKTPYILPKIDTMMLPKFKYGGMENVGLIVIDGNSVKYIHAVTNSNSILIVNLIAHELIHQWIGNLVTPKEWKYIWLSEGITKFLEFLITDKLHPNMFPNHKYISFDLIYHRTAMEVDSTENFHPVEFYFDPSTEAFVKHFSFSYYKGFCITQMIYHLLGDKQFEKGINAYIANYAYKSVSSNDFFAVMDRYVEKRQPNSPNLIEVGLSWTSQAGFPLITVTQVSDTIISLKQEMVRYSAFWPSKYSQNTTSSFIIPIWYYVNSEERFVWMTTKTMELKIGEGTLIINGDSKGTYSINYDLTRWNEIFNAMDRNWNFYSDKLKLIFIDDFARAMRMGKIPDGFSKKVSIIIVKRRNFFFMSQYLIQLYDVFYKKFIKIQNNS